MNRLLTLAIALLMATSMVYAKERVTIPCTSYSPDARGEEVMKTHFSIAKEDYASQEKKKFNWNEAIDNQDADKPAKYRGGVRKLREDISKNLVYPTSVLEGKLQGIVMVVFALDEEGRVAAIKIIKSLSPDCDQAAATAVSKLKGFKPAMHHGKAVPVRFTLPIRFQM